MALTPADLSTRPGPRQIIRTWWPLAASWLLMSAEIPILSSVIARLANPEINLAAYGGIVFPLALIIESPIIMLLAASTALSRDRASYNLVRRYMMTASAFLTLIHALVVFTPLYDLVVVGLIDPPPEIIEPARLGLMLMLPWTWSIAYRRFNQGVMIRFGHSDAVIGGTIARMVVGAVILLIGYTLNRSFNIFIPGIAVATAAQAISVVTEAFYARWRVRPVLRTHYADQAAGTPGNSSTEPSLTWRGFASFYIPLVLTSLISLLWQPIGSAAISRMPSALASLAAWPVLSGAVFILRSFGIAFNEVVVALLTRPGSSRPLSRFAAWLSLIITAAHLLLAATPLASLYFEHLSGLSPELAALTRTGFWIALPMGALSAYLSWYQGAILFSGKTRAIPESVVIFFIVVLAGLGVGLVLNTLPGLFVAMAALTFANAAQTAWLGFRSRTVRRQVAQRDL